MEQVEEYVKGKWQQLTAFSARQDVNNRLWNELAYRYAERHRHYHNLNHIAYIFSLCDKHIGQITKPAVVGFAVLYHDVVYNTYHNDNEEQSAAVAEMHLQQLKVKQQLIEDVKTFILATKDHKIPLDFSLKNDLALFLDFDMAILASEPETYSIYSQKIRQEYGKYSDEIYNEGRKMALSKMLDATLFHTPQFKEMMEEKARNNMRNELGGL